MDESKSFECLDAFLVSTEFEHRKKKKKDCNQNCRLLKSTAMFLLYIH